jgi:hypothetical protein
MFNLPPNEFDRAQWETHRGGRNEGNTVATLPPDNSAMWGAAGRMTPGTGAGNGPQVGPHLFFNAQGATDRPEGFQNPFVMGGNGMGLVSRDQALNMSQSSRSGNWGYEANLPEQAMGKNQWKQGLTQTPIANWQQDYRQNLNPYNINMEEINRRRNALATAPTPATPLQGYQNALLTGF